MACASTGAFVLADPKDPVEDAAERLIEWLTGRHRRRCEATWPADLADLKERLDLAGEHGLTMADFDDFVAGTLALAKAETQGLVYELSPGRYIIHPSKR
jgi:hypothetical protein